MHSHAAPGTFRRLRGDRKRAQCLGMRNFTDLPSVPSDHLVPITDQLWLALAAYLARFKGSSRYHTESDLRCYLTWCTEHGLDPLAARRPHLELYIRWMQEIRRFKSSTVSRRFSVTAGFYRTCVIDGVLDHSPLSTSAGPPSRRSPRPLGSPTCSSKPCSPPPGNQPARATSRWSPCSGSSACESSRRRARPPGAACVVRAPRSSCYHCHLPSAGPSTRPSAAAPEDRSCSTAAAPGWTATPRPAGYGIWPKLPACGSPGRTLTCSATPTSRSCSTRAWTCEMSRSLPGMRIRGPRCAMTGLEEPRPPSELHLAAYMASGT